MWHYYFRLFSGAVYCVFLFISSKDKRCGSCNHPVAYFDDHYECPNCRIEAIHCQLDVDSERLRRYSFSSSFSLVEKKITVMYHP